MSGNGNNYCILLAGLNAMPSHSRPAISYLSIFDFRYLNPDPELIMEELSSSMLPKHRRLNQAIGSLVGTQTFFIACFVYFKNMGRVYCKVCLEKGSIREENSKIIGLFWLYDRSTTMVW